MIEPIGGDVRRELARFGPAEGMAHLVERWPAAVGAEIARNTWPARIGRDGTLHVHTRDAVWAFELTQRAGEIAARVGATHLKFAPGPLPEPPLEARIAAPEATLEEARTAASWAAGIGDPELRRLVARAARASLVNAATGRRF
jgi:hypothetical protein